MNIFSLCLLFIRSYLTSSQTGRFLSTTRCFVSAKMQPLQKFRESMKFLHAYYKFIGQDSIADEFQRTNICYIIFGLMLTIIVFYALDLFGTNDLDESIRVTQACVQIGVLQVTIKFYLMKDLQALRPIVTFLEDIYRKNAWPNERYYGICCRYARFTQFMLTIGAACYAVTIAFTILSALIESFLTMEPSFYVYFPFVREYSMVQLVLLDTFIGIAGSSCIFVMPACDFFFYLVVANFTMIPLIIAAQMDELSTRLEHGQANSSEFKRRWMHYIRIHYKYNR